LCTLFLFINQFKNIPIAIVSNRDESRERSSSIIQGWDKKLNSFGNEIISPKDETKKGTWFACQNEMNGKWAILTNIRDPASHNSERKSRGDIILNFLNSGDSASGFLERLKNTAHEYNHFNIIFSDYNFIYYFHSKENEFEILHQNGSNEKKIFGLSNGKIDSNWPKIINTKERFLEFIVNKNENHSEFYWNYFKYEMMNDKKYEINLLPKTGVSLEIEVFLSALFIRGEKYGTRSTLFFGIDRNASTFFYEQTYDLNSEIDLSKNIALRFYGID
jgi:uncharacterized protein with NRDE domain